MGMPDASKAAIRGFYDAATGHGAWSDAFDALLLASGFEAAAFYVIDRSTGQALDERWHRFDTAYAEPYLRDYVAIDPRAAEVFKPRRKRILYDYLHTAEDEIDRDPFYAWFQQTQGHRYYVGGQSGLGDGSDDLAMTLTLHRTRKQGHASGGELARFETLFSHFEHAVRLQHSLSLDATREAARLSELECAAHGVVLLGQTGQVLHANQAAQAIATRADGLTLSAAGIGARVAAAHDDVRRLIASALAGGVTSPVEIARCFGGHPYIVTAFPMRGADTLTLTGRARAALRILDPDAGLGGTDKIASLLGLTRQEARILGALLDGADPVEIAAATGLRAATVRTYLAAIYRKAGVSRQAALVARVAALQRFL